MLAEPKIKHKLVINFNVVVITIVVLRAWHSKNAK